jgi:hypothetical protein
MLNATSVATFEFSDPECRRKKDHKWIVKAESLVRDFLHICAQARFGERGKSFLEATTWILHGATAFARLPREARCIFLTQMLHWRNLRNRDEYSKRRTAGSIASVPIS